MREIVFSRIGCGDLVFPRERKGWREDECSELRPSASFSAVIRRSSRRSHLTASYLCLASADCRRAPGADGARAGTLDLEDTLSRGHDARHFRTGGLHRRLAALVPKPRTHLTRYHGVLAPASALRARVGAERAGAGDVAVPAPSIRRRKQPGSSGIVR